MSAALWNGPHSTTTSQLRTALTPYLTLPHLLSLTWLAAPILSLIFVAFRLQLSLADAQNALDRTKVNLLASCLAAEQAATSTVSMPRYLALATNKQFAEAVNGSLEAARLTLVLSITVLEGVINFVIDIYRSTFLCLLELVVRGGLSILLGAVQQINEAVQTVAGGVRSTFQQEVSSANSIIQTAVDAVNRLNPFNKISAPLINVPNLDSLENPNFASSLQESIVKLNDTIPSSSEIKQKLQDILNTPFELLKKEINDTFLGLSFNPDGLPIPAQKGVTFCERLDTSVVDDLGSDLLRTVKIGVLLLLAVAIVLISMNCLLTWYRWRCMKRHFEYTRQAWATDPTIMHPNSRGSSAPQVTLNDHNLMLLGADFQNPFITRIMNQFSTKFRLSPRQHTHTRWFLQYIFHAPAIACLLIGFFGVLSIELQLLAMGPLVAKYRGRAQSAVSDFNELIASSINSSMQNQSATYAAEVNGRVVTIEGTLNGGLFGWVNGTTTTLNNTINAVYTDVQNAVTLVFGGTILETPAQQFVRCLIGSKVEAIENAITFLHDNLNVAMPRVDQNVLVLSPESVDEATKPIAAAAIGGGTEDDQGFLGQVIQAYVASLKKERLMFLIFIALWGLVVLLGLAVVIWHSTRKAKNTEQEQITNFPADNEKGGVTFDPPPSKRVSLESLWLNTKYPPSNSSITSEESVAHKESARSKLLAAGRKAFSREPKPKKDEEEMQQPVQDTKSAIDRYGDWYAKIMSLLARKEKDDRQESEPVEDERDKSPPKPEIQIITPIPPKQESPRTTRFQFSTSPKPTPAWKNLIAPPKRSTQTPTFVPLPLSNMPTVVAIPERGSTPPPRITSKTPLLAELMSFPIPLHTGFDNEPFQSTETMTEVLSRSQSVSSVVMSSPRTILYQTPLLPPAPPLVVQHLHPPVPVPPKSPGRRRRSTSVGGQQSSAITSPQWNALPRDSPPIPLTLDSSKNDNNESSKGGENAYDNLPMARSFGTADARKSTANPFVTPFDDEFQVRTNQLGPGPS